MILSWTLSLKIGPSGLDEAEKAPLLYCKPAHLRTHLLRMAAQPAQPVWWIAQDCISNLSTDAVLLLIKGLVWEEAQATECYWRPAREQRRMRALSS